MSKSSSKQNIEHVPPVQVAKKEDSILFKLGARYCANRFLLLLSAGRSIHEMEREFQGMISKIDSELDKLVLD